MERKTSFFELKKETKELFDTLGIDIVDFEWICCEILGKKRSELVFEKEIDEKNVKKIRRLVAKRAKHIPLDYIFGKSEFMGHDFKVNKNVLIPRIDTEILTQQVINEIRARKCCVKVLEIGVGSGAVIETIALETDSVCTGVDISRKALKIAKFNAKQNNAKVKFLKSNIFEKIKNEKFDLIVSNPPYIESQTIKSLEIEVKDHEPILALDGGVDGLDYYRKIISESPKFLNDGGKLFFEIGYNQAESVKNLMKDNFKKINVIKDYGNNDRVVMGEKLWLKDYKK